MKNYVKLRIEQRRKEEIRICESNQNQLSLQRVELKKIMNEMIYLADVAEVFVKKFNEQMDGFH